jgi:hypothetical protein
MSRLRCPRLRLSKLMEAVAALAVLLAFWTWRHYYRYSTIFDVLTALVTVISVFVIATVLSGATENNHRSLDRWSKGLGILNLLIALWFVSVEWDWSFEDCPNCHNSRRIFEYRLFSIVVRREVGEWDHPTMIEMVAADLGIPCSHGRAFRGWHQRLSGLCLCVEHGGMRLYDPPWYPTCAQAAVRSWLAKDPSFAQTFRKRVLEDFDRLYWRSLIFQMYDACPANQLPDHPLNRDEPPPD